MTATFETLCGLDDALVRAGHHPLTPWWREEMARFYSHPTARTYVGRVGRGGAKSHTSVKVSFNETLFGDWKVPPGERHFWAYVSRTKDEAAQRLLLIESFLRALGIPFDTHGDQIALRDTPRGWRVFACQVGAVSGFRCYGRSADELSKWNIEGTNPAAEVVASLSAMCITHRGARQLLITSPLGTGDFHAVRFAKGDTADQIVAHAPSWVANPGGITEQDTIDAEPDERIRRREYGAIPQDGTLEGYLASVIGRCVDTNRITSEPQEGFDYLMALDPAGGGADGRGDNFTSSVGHRERRGRQVYTVLDAARVWTPAAGTPLVLPDVVRESVDDIERYHRALTITDQWSYPVLREMYAQRGVMVQDRTWSATTKLQRFGQVRAAMSAGLVRLPNVPSLLRELGGIRIKILPSGVERIEGIGHDDQAFAAVLCLSELMERFPDYTCPDAPHEPSADDARRLEREERLERRIRRMQRTNDILEHDDPASMERINLEWRRGIL